MGHGKIKNLVSSGNDYKFMLRWSNDTSDYAEYSRSKLDFFHSLMGGIYQMGSPKVSNLLAEFQQELGAKYDTVWWEIENWGVAAANITNEQLGIFMKYFVAFDGLVKKQSNKQMIVIS